MSQDDNYGPFIRVNFFNGMLLTEKDLQTEQEYHRKKLRMHNRCSHGCRVVCGLDVKLRRNLVYIDEGMALDCCGREIIVAEPTKISLPKRKRRFFLSIFYSELKTNPVPPVSLCDDTKVKYTRIQESFKLDWTSKDPLSGHGWHDGAWVTCGRSHPMAIAKFVIKKGQIILDKSFAKKISAGRQNWG